MKILSAQDRVIFFLDLIPTVDQGFSALTLAPCSKLQAFEGMHEGSRADLCIGVVLSRSRNRSPTILLGAGAGAGADFFLRSRSRLTFSRLHIPAL